MAGRPAFHPLEVARVEALTEDSVALTFAVPPQLATEFRFSAGQHLNIRSADDVRRSYSICSPAPDGPLRVAVKRLEGGGFSTHATTGLRAGDRLEVMTPTGHFSPALDPARARHYCCVAAGSGITPILSILATVLQVEPASSVTLIYGNRSTRATMFLDELADLKDRYPDRLQMLYLFSREAQDAELLCGRIDAAKMTALLDNLVPVAGVDEWYLCGPYAMVTDVRDVLLGRGVPVRAVHAELFHVDAQPRPRPAPDAVAEGGSRSSVTIRLDGRASTFELSPDGESILDAALRERADAPYACKGGVCGTCRAKLVEGQVEMAGNYALQPDELAAGFVLACQSSPRSEQVVLDFDA
ncbi:MAG: phenylacetate-CoA oxygenase/reductase subunit PaaK [Actinomycetota bacterium]|nr:phenylacetate-CoA oxygenase/reductase subunit PaaK [Actinomycetota bacterium]